MRFETPATGGVAALCLEPHDLWIAKAIANRPKDVYFCDAPWVGRPPSHQISMTTALASVKNSRLYRPPSRPMPESL